MIDLRNKHGIICYRAKGAYLEDAPESIWTSNKWVMEPKMDGWRVTLQIGKKQSLLIGRNRQDQAKGVDNAGDFRDLSDSNPYLKKAAIPRLDGTLLDGESTEAYNDDGTLSKSTRKRMMVREFIGYTTWGALFYMGKDVRRRPESERYGMAGEAIEIMMKHELLMTRVQLIPRVAATREQLQKFFDSGLEGAIAKHRDMGLPGDQRTNPFWWKLKGAATRTVDAFIVGVTEGKAGGSGVRGIKAQPDGTAASFTVAMYREGKIVDVGKMKYLPVSAEHCGLRNFNNYKGRVVEMKVSGWNGEEFRFPRFVKYRPDKVKTDCQFEEQVGKKNAER